MKIAFIFPGQGAQSVGMGKDIYEQYEQARKIYEIVYEKTKINIADITFNGTEEQLSNTQYCQLAILTMSLAILEILKNKKIQAEISAGLSLGEYSALIYADAMPIDTGIEIVSARGKIMQENIPTGDWKMAAILGVNEELVKQICEKVKNGFAAPANYNCPGQIVISGESSAINEAMQLLKTQGAKAIELKTKGPFHTIKLNNASEKLKQELQKYKIVIPNKTVIKNIDGLPYKQTDDIKQILANHVIEPVMFANTIQNMLDYGIDTFVEIGPGKTLTGFIKKINKQVKTININNLETLEQAIKYLEDANQIV